MTKEQKDKILKALAEDRNDYARECENRITAEQGKITGADYMIQRFFNVLNTEVEAQETNESISTSYCINIPEGATNGEVLCMLFPNMHYTLSDKSPRVVTTIGVASSFDMDWWNAEYKVKSEGINADSN